MKKAKTTLYEISSGLTVLFVPVIFGITFLTGYQPNLAFPFSPISLLIFLCLITALSSSLLQKALLTKKPKNHTRWLTVFSSLNLILLLVATFLLFSTRIT